MRTTSTFERTTSGAAAAILLITLASATGCLNHYLIYCRSAPSGVSAWTQDVERGPLIIHLEWASPFGAGPHPAVLVHPEAGKTALDMRGVIYDLASHGYLAAAADYERVIDGKARRTLFPFRDEAESLAALELLRSHPAADPSRVAVMGFSQGGVFSLLFAATAPSEVRAVVAYYPVTDFVTWLAPGDAGLMKRFVFRMIRRHFRKESGARDESDFQGIRERISPLRRAEEILAPVLLVHGSRDTTAPVEESQRLAARLKVLGRDVKLIVVENAGHVFNFKDRESASIAWEATLRWLDERMRR